MLDETTYYFTAFAIDQNNNIIDSETSSITTDFGWHVTPNTLFYLNLDQSDGIFTDKKGHTVTNNGVQYSANGVVKGAGYNNVNRNRIRSPFNSGESFPTQFTIMAFMKPSGNHYTNDHPMGIALSNESSKVVWGIGFSQTNNRVYWNHLRENVAWDDKYISFSPLNTRHHYVMTVDGSTMKGYIDGVLKGTWTVSGNGSGNPYPLNGLSLFGRYVSNDSANPDGLANTIQGYVDEAIVENKVWTQSEIQSYLQKIGFIS